MPKWQIEWHYIASGKLMQSGFVGSFKSWLRDECLNEHLLASHRHAREVTGDWRLDYILNRPRVSLDGLRPLDFATWSAQDHNMNSASSYRGQIADQVSCNTGQQILLAVLLPRATKRHRKADFDRVASPLHNINHSQCKCSCQTRICARSISLGWKSSRVGRLRVAQFSVPWNTTYD